MISQLEVIHSTHFVVKDLSLKLVKIVCWVATQRRVALKVSAKQFYRDLRFIIDSKPLVACVDKYVILCDFGLKMI